MQEMPEEAGLREDRLTRILENGTVFSRHKGTFCRLVVSFEVVTNIFHLYPFHSSLSTDIFNQPRKYI